jgi:hypothetical protein
LRIVEGYVFYPSTPIVAEDPVILMDMEWNPSEVTEEDVLTLVRQGLLPEQAVAGWRVPGAAEPYPMPDANQAVVFEDAFARGFGLPTHPFLRCLLLFYGLQLCHLGPTQSSRSPSSSLSVSVFLGSPNFHLWQYFFMVVTRGTPGSRVAGAVYFKIRDGRAGQYIHVPLPSNVGGWMHKWFYLPQPAGAPTVPCNPSRVPVRRSSWNAPVPTEEMPRVLELVDMISQLNITGVDCGRLFIDRRFQPCKDRDHPSYEYTGPHDGTREAEWVLSMSEVLERLGKILLKERPSTGRQAPAFCAAVPPPLVSVCQNVSVVVASGVALVVAMMYACNCCRSTESPEPPTSPCQRPRQRLSGNGPQGRCRHLLRCLLPETGAAGSVPSRTHCTGPGRRSWPVDHVGRPRRRQAVGSSCCPMKKVKT